MAHRIAPAKCPGSSAASLPACVRGKSASVLAIDGDSIIVIPLIHLVGKPVPGDNSILFERTQNAPDCTTALSRRFSRRADHL
jgi:hypothetical protein